MNDLDGWRLARARLAAGERVFFACVVDHTRHSPGTRGARLVLCEDGTSLGTIGGGVMERDLIRRGAVGLRAGHFEPEHRVLGHRGDASDPSGLICAGAQTNVAVLLQPSRDLAIVAEVVRRVEADAPGTLSVRRDGLAIDAEVDGLAHVDLLNPRRTVVFGGGHCAEALCRQLTLLDHVVTCVHTRGNPPARHQLPVGDYFDGAAMVSWPEATDAVVMTSDLHGDVQALRGLLARPFRFVGVMGAPAKIAAIHRSLAAQGVADTERARITAPVGLPIGSRTPAEIAVAVAGQLVARHRHLEETQ